METKALDKIRLIHSPFTAIESCILASANHGFTVEANEAAAEFSDLRSENAELLKFVNYVSQELDEMSIPVVRKSAYKFLHPETEAHQ